MKKVVISLCIGIFLIASIFLINSCLDYNDDVEFENNIDLDIQNNTYQGPVQEGYDEEYFRRTGITKIKEDNK